MLRKFVVPALVALGLIGSSLSVPVFAQKPTPAPKSDKMGSKKETKKKSDKKGPERGPDGKFLKKDSDDKKKSERKKSDKSEKEEKSEGDSKMGSSRKKKSDKDAPERGPGGRFVKKDKGDEKPEGAEKSDKMGSSRRKSDKMGSSKSDKGSSRKTKIDNPTGEKPVWDAGVKRWRLNGRFISEADALKMGGRK